MKMLRLTLFSIVLFNLTQGQAAILDVTLLATDFRNDRNGSNSDYIKIFQCKQRFDIKPNESVTVFLKNNGMKVTVASGERPFNEAENCKDVNSAGPSHTYKYFFGTSGGTYREVNQRILTFTEDAVRPERMVVWARAPSDFWLRNWFGSSRIIGAAWGSKNQPFQVQSFNDPKDMLILNMQ